MLFERIIFCLKNVNIKNQKIKNQNIGTIWYLGEYARRNVLFPLTLHQSLHGKLACIPESSWNLIHVHVATYKIKETGSFRVNLKNSIHLHLIFYSNVIVHHFNGIK